MRPDLKLKQRVEFYSKKLKKVLKIQVAKLKKKELKQELIPLSLKILTQAIQKSDRKEIAENNVIEMMGLQEYTLELLPFEKELEKRVQKSLTEHLDDICRILRKERKEPVKKMESAVEEQGVDVPGEVILDEEWVSDDEETDLVDAEPIKKKNRRGQQARRAIWEKKFGEKAKHVVEGKLKKKEKKPVAPGKVEPPKEELHPSWQAKKMAKEQQAKLATVKPTKIIFNDDD